MGSLCRPDLFLNSAAADAARTDKRRPSGRLEREPNDQAHAREMREHDRALFSRCTRSCTAARLVAMALSEATMKVMVGVRPSPSAITRALSLSVANET